jgi:hypothetical protein
MPRTTIAYKETDSSFKFVGLKPLTTHYFYFNKKKQTSRVKQLGKKLGQPLISDDSGVLEVIYYLDSGISSDSPSNTSYKIPNLTVGVVEIVVTNLDSGASDLPDEYLNNSLSSGRVVFNALKK